MIRAIKRIEVSYKIDFKEHVSAKDRKEIAQFVHGLISCIPTEVIEITGEYKTDREDDDGKE